MRMDECHFGKMLALPVSLVYYFARHDPCVNRSLEVSIFT